MARDVANVDVFVPTATVALQKKKLNYSTSPDMVLQFGMYILYFLERAGHYFLLISQLLTKEMLI